MVFIYSSRLPFYVPMGSPTANPPSGPSRITLGAILVLAYLHEHDAACSEIASETGLAESSVYRWVTELEDAGILEAQATRTDTGRAVVVYHLADDDLGAAARVVSDRLAPTEADT